MARIPFTDAHVHFYDVGDPVLHRSWAMRDAPPDPILGDHSAIKAQRWADDSLAQVRMHNVERVIHAECAQGIADPVEETRWLPAFADRLSAPHGIVARADLSAANARETLERHSAFANLRGIRDLRNDAYLTDSWRTGYADLEELGLVFCHSTGALFSGNANRIFRLE